MGNSLIATDDIAINNTSGTGLSAGTKTLETNALAALVVGGPITASLNGTIVGPFDFLRNDVSDGEHPLVLAQNEGFIIRAVVVPATGIWQFSVQVDWCECASY
jgi:hypothetical protein